jgi:hypothetical protein
MFFMPTPWKDKDESGCQIPHCAAAGALQGSPIAPKWDRFQFSQYCDHYRPRQPVRKVTLIGVWKKNWCSRIDDWRSAIDERGAAFGHAEPDLHYHLVLEMFYPANFKTAITEVPTCRVPYHLPPHTALLPTSENTRTAGASLLPGAASDRIYFSRRRKRNA